MEVLSMKKLATDTNEKDIENILLASYCWRCPGLFSLVQRGEILYLSHHISTTFHQSNHIF
jgi:hypothetical protein